jgi:hypothetical protein
VKREKVAKRLIVFLVVFSLVFSQPLGWVGSLSAQETAEGSPWEEWEGPQTPEWPQRSNDETPASNWPLPSWFQEEKPEPSPQPEDSFKPSSTPIPSPDPEPAEDPLDNPLPTESPLVTPSPPVVNEIQSEFPNSVENQQAGSQTNEQSLDDPLNENTGPDSENIASYEEEEKVSIFNSNNAWISNKIDSFINTGWNKANYNTGHGTITTGSAYAWGRLQTKANTNSASIPALPEDGLIGAVAQNEETGSGSTNLTEAEILNELEIVNENSFENVNEIGILSNTGSNEAMYNTGSGLIASGDAQAAVDLVTNANSNFVNSDESAMGSFSLFGENTGDLDFSNFGQAPVFESSDETLIDGFVEEDVSFFETDSPVLASNTTTGPNSENYDVIEATSSAKIRNDNLAVVENDVLVAATTGDNTSSYNTGDGIVESGDADLIANVVNFINTNVVNSEVVLATINVFGEWVGDLILPVLGLEGSSSEAAAVIASNKNTGPDSQNETATSIDLEFEAINDNDGLIINDLNPEANTGENRAEHNTKSGIIETGESLAQASIASVANQNITNDNPILLIINTLGEWVGEIISPTGATSHESGEQDVLVYSTFGGESVNFADGPATLAESFNNETGPNSENITEIDIDKSTLIENTNDFVIENNIELLADTGGNEASCNTGQGIVKSGDANLASNLVNFVNTNIADSKVIVAVVNVFGEWLGNILAPESPEDDWEGQETGIGDNTDFDSEEDLSGSTDDPPDDGGDGGGSSQGSGGGNSSNDFSSQGSDGGNSPESSDDQAGSSSSQGDSSQQDNSSQDELPSDDLSQEDPPLQDSPSSDNNDTDQYLLGTLINDNDSGPGFSGGSFSGAVESSSSQGVLQRNSSSVLGARLTFDPYGFSTSLGTFLVASPQVSKMIGEKSVNFFADLISQLPWLSLLLIIVTSIGGFLKKPTFWLKI